MRFTLNKGRVVVAPARRQSAFRAAGVTQSRRAVHTWDCSVLEETDPTHITGKSTLEIEPIAHESFMLARPAAAAVLLRDLHHFTLSWCIRILSRARLSPPRLQNRTRGGMWPSVTSATDRP